MWDRAEREQGLEEQVWNGLEGLLKEKGFIRVPAFNQFRKPTLLGFQCVITSLSHYPDLSLLEIHLGIRVDQVENMVYSFTNAPAGFRPESLTLVTPLARLKHLPMERFEIQDEKGLRSALSKIREDLDRTGLPFLALHDRLEPLHELFNQNPNSPLRLIHNQYHRCLRGLGIASILQIQDLDQLTHSYRQLMQQQGMPPQHISRFDRLCSYLKSYVPN